MRKHFNTTGPCLPNEHYMLPPLPRVKAAMELVEDGKYFVLHAPRQSGKTTSLLAMRDELNRQGEVYAVYCSMETAAEVGDTGRVMAIVISALREAFLYDLGKEMSVPVGELPPEQQLQQFLSVSCRSLDKPLVLLLDEVDGLVDGPLLSLLRQLRLGYIQRGTRPFPVSVALVGMRNIRDYRVRLRPEQESLGTASPFNVVAKYLSLDSFTLEQVTELYAQHTAATGQRFAAGVAARVFHWTNGQPWLVNAIANECVDEICGRDYTREVTETMVDAAAYAIILRRDVHIDSLLARLAEPRVQRILQPVILGENLPVGDFDNDLSFVLDLGLLRRDPGTKRLLPANRMYAEVFLRTLSSPFQERALTSVPSPPWARADGLDMDGLLRGFQAFWRENSEICTREMTRYPEALPQLVLMGFLQRVLNGGGRIVREYALGLRRIDLLVEYRGGRYPIELKVKGNGTREEAVAQLLDYMEKCGQADGWLVVFDRDASRPWQDRLTWEELERDGRRIRIVGA